MALENGLTTMLKKDWVKNYLLMNGYESIDDLIKDISIPLPSEGEKEMYKDKTYKKHAVKLIEWLQENGKPTQEIIINDESYKIVSTDSYRSYGHINGSINVGCGEAYPKTTSSPKTKRSVYLAPSHIPQPIINIDRSFTVDTFYIGQAEIKLQRDGSIELIEGTFKSNNTIIGVSNGKEVFKQDSDGLHLKP